MTVPFPFQVLSFLSSEILKRRLLKSLLDRPVKTHAVSFHNFKPQNFKLSVSNPKNKYVADVSVLSKSSKSQGLGRKNKFETLKTDRRPYARRVPDLPYVYIYIYIHTYASLSLSLYIHVSYIYIYLFSYIYIYIYTYVHSYIYGLDVPALEEYYKQ